MYTVGMDADTRAYFTAATGAISFNKSLSVITPLLFFKKNNLYRNYTINNFSCNTNLTLWNKSLGLSSMNNKSNISNMERNMLKLTSKVKSIIIGFQMVDCKKEDIDILGLDLNNHLKIFLIFDTFIMN